MSNPGSAWAEPVRLGVVTPPDGALLHPIEVSYALDWGRIGQHLAQTGLQLDAQFTPRQFAGGLANLNYLVRVDEQWMVLRRPPPGRLPPGAHDMAREYKILRGLWRALPIAPRAIHLCEDASVAGAPFQLIEFRDGIVINGESLARMDAPPATAQALGDMLVETLAVIHDVDLAAVGLTDLGRPDGFLTRAVAGWTSRGERATGGTPAVRALSLWLERQIPESRPEPTLLHNDFKLDNIILDPSTLAPAAVLDWDMGTVGDPLFDLGTLLSYWCDSGDPVTERHHSQIPAVAGLPTREQAAFAYARRTGRSLDHFRFYRVLTLFKLGVVFHQLHERHRAGAATDGRYARFDRLGDELFEFALAITTGRYF